MLLLTYVFSHILVIFRSHFSAKDELKTAQETFPAVRHCAMKKYEIYQNLKREASKNCPSPMTVQWKTFVWKV
jgi:thiaminase